MKIENNNIVPEWLNNIPVFPVKSLPPEKMKDGILIRSPNWLGDAVMTLPALMQLKKMMPESCGLFVICPENLTGLFRALPFVAKIFPLQQTHRNWTTKEREQLKRINPGAAILFNNSLRDAIHLRLAGIHRLYGAAARCRGFLLHRSFKFERRKDAVLNGLQHTCKYLAMVQALGAPPWQGELPEFNLPAFEQGLRHELMPLVSQKKLLTIAAGAAYGSSKRWDSESFNAVAAWWIEQGGTVAVLGSSSERAICQEAIKSLPPDKAQNLAGITDLTELMLILRHAAVSLANDSGIMHLAAALGTPGIALFGPTDPSATAPVSGNWKILYQQEPCAPCFKRECPRNTRACMTGLTPDMVIDELKRLV